jgi:pyruvate dehydrogenase complex dehydrogenase (E1) component
VSTQRKRPVISDGLPSQLPDIDPEETTEWVESLDGVIDERGAKRARYVMLRLLERARERQATGDANLTKRRLASVTQFAVRPRPPRPAR